MFPLIRYEKRYEKNLMGHKWTSRWGKVPLIRYWIWKVQNFFRRFFLVFPTKLSKKVVNDVFSYPNCTIFLLFFLLSMMPESKVWSYCGSGGHTRVKNRNKIFLKLLKMTHLGVILCENRFCAFAKTFEKSAKNSKKN
jgi:hypothetical protein